MADACPLSRVFPKTCGCHKIVVFEGDARHVGQVLDLKIVRRGSFTLYGDPVLHGLDEA